IEDAAIYIDAVCSSCGHQYNVSDKLAGKKIKCRKCAAVFLVKGAEPSAPSAAPKPVAATSKEVSAPPPPPKAARPKKPAPVEDADEAQPAKPRRKKPKEEGGISILTLTAVGIATLLVLVLGITLAVMLTSKSSTPATGPNAVAPTTAPTSPGVAAYNRGL